MMKRQEPVRRRKEKVERRERRISIQDHGMTRRNRKLI